MIYLDNAATTSIYPEVLEIMTKTMKEVFGNPSSNHSEGRKSKNLIESSRKSIASFFQVSSSEIVFTSSATEADNLILFNAVKNLGVKRIITSKIEHHAVLHTVEELESTEGIKVDYVNLTSKGEIDIAHLEKLLLASEVKTLVSLMYVNNEIGNVLPIAQVSTLCKKYNALFHSDTVQAIGHYAIDLSMLDVDFIVGSGHKFHGPKGVGFAFIRKGIGIQPMIYGGNQEKGARSSTENIHAIAGMEKALAMSMSKMESATQKVTKLKKYCIDKLLEFEPGITFNGTSDMLDKSCAKILSVCFPYESPMLLFQLDMQGIAVSGGSACQSGALHGSHVLAEIYGDKNKNTSIRVSFTESNTLEEIDKFIEALKTILT